jgi:hypothetical protein
MDVVFMAAVDYQRQGSWSERKQAALGVDRFVTGMAADLERAGGHERRSRQRYQATGFGPL